VNASVGRIVHYVSHGTPVRADGTQAFTGQCRAAIVTEVGDPEATEPELMDVSLAVLNPTGMFFNQDVPYSEDRAGGSWHWPERV